MCASRRSRQVERNTESRARQYALRERAVELGWPAGVGGGRRRGHRSLGRLERGRLGFKELVAEVGLGHVGLVLALEASRLARSSADWHQLLDLCALTATLIADADGVYSPGDFNDRLLLGLKGTMSEAELHLIRARLDGGLRNKAERGELRSSLPVGLDRDEDGRIVLCPMSRSATRSSACSCCGGGWGPRARSSASCRERDSSCRAARSGQRRVRWAPASYGAVHDLLTNPAYAGAFVFGRTRQKKRAGRQHGEVSADGRSSCRWRSGPSACPSTIPAMSPGTSTSPPASGCART